MGQASPRDDHADAHRILEGQVRGAFGRVAYSHKTHEKCADILSTRQSRIKITQIVLSAATAAGFLAAVFGAGQATAVLGVIVSTVLLSLSAYTGQFAVGLLEALGQAPARDPLRRPPPTSEVFEAAVRAIGSNTRSWSKFVSLDPRIAALLYDYDPGAVAADVGSGRMTADDLKPLFQGITGRSDATAVLRWSEKAHRGLFNDQVLATVQALQEVHRSALGKELPKDVVILLLVSYLAAPTLRLPVVRWMQKNPSFNPSEWKLPGMGAMLGSEFFRNLGWSGLKPDRHVIRLLDRWCPEFVEAQHSMATELARAVGRRDRAMIGFLTYSLAGQGVTPPDTSFSVADNVIWVLGA